MKKQLLALLSVFIAAFSLLSAAPVLATVLTSSWQSGAFNFSTINASANLTFDGFDDSLGSLIGVSIKFTVDETLQDRVYNFSENPSLIGAPVSVSATSTITASGPLGLTSVNQLTTTGYTGTVVSGLSTISTSTLTGFLVGPVVLNGNPISLASYIGGTNSVTITVASFGTQSGSLSPDVLTGYSGSSDGIVGIQYIYAIPEPAAIALFALGLMLLLLYRRRKGAAG